MGWFGGKKKAKRRPPVLEPVGVPAVQAAPVAQPAAANQEIPAVQAAPAAIQPVPAVQPVVEIAPVGVAADSNVMVSADPIPAPTTPSATGWAKKSEKPLMTSTRD